MTLSRAEALPVFIPLGARNPALARVAFEEPRFVTALDEALEQNDERTFKAVLVLYGRLLTVRNELIAAEQHS